MEQARSGKVMVVDDDLVSAVVVQELLKSEGCAVEWHDDARVALDAARRDELALVITDWFMPGMDGGEFCRQLRAVYPQVPVICMSGSPDAARRGLPPEAGAVSVLAKPLNRSVLLREVRACLATG